MNRHPSTSCHIRVQYPFMYVGSEVYKPSLRDFVCSLFPKAILFDFYYNSTNGAMTLETTYRRKVQYDWLAGFSGDWHYWVRIALLQINIRLRKLFQV